MSLQEASGPYLGIPDYLIRDLSNPPRFSYFAGESLPFLFKRKSADDGKEESEEYEGEGHGIRRSGLH